MSSGSGRGQSRREFLQMLGARRGNVAVRIGARAPAGGRLACSGYVSPTSPSRLACRALRTFPAAPLTSSSCWRKWAVACALFDYDNDGWLDIFLVNGTSLDPAVRDRNPTSYLFHNNRDGTFTDVTEKAAPDPLGLGTRLLRRRLRQRRFRRSVRQLFWPQRSLPQQWRRHFHRRVRTGWRCWI